MNKRYLFIILLFIVVIAFPVVMFYKKPGLLPKIPPQRPTVVEKNTEVKIKSSIPYWDQESALASFTNNVGKHDFLNLFWYYLSEDGKISKYIYAVEDRDILALARDNNVKTLLTITNLPEKGGWDTDRVERMLKTSDSRAAHIQDLVKKVDDLGFDGVNIDYEEVDESEKNRFTLFIIELEQALHANGKLLSISFHPKREEDEGLGKFQDWKALSEHSDQVTIMAFNEHYDEGSAGPVASIPWLEKIIAYAQFLEVDEEKIYLGVPFFGYDWNHDNEESADGLTYLDVKKLLDEHDAEEEWDDEFKSPYFMYEDEDGDEHEVWYENARSIQEKIDLAERTGLAGVSFWRLGGEDLNVWSEL